MFRTNVSLFKSARQSTMLGHLFWSAAHKLSLLRLGTRRSCQRPDYINVADPRWLAASAQETCIPLTDYNVALVKLIRLCKPNWNLLTFVVRFLASLTFQPQFCCKCACTNRLWSSSLEGGSRMVAANSLQITDLRLKERNWLQDLTVLSSFLMNNTWSPHASTASWARCEQVRLSAKIAWWSCWAAISKAS